MVSKITAVGRKLVKKVRRRIDTLRSLHRTLDVDELERNVVNALYIETATSLGLEHRFRGRVLVISKEGREVFRMSGLETQFDNYATGALCGDKTACRELLAEAGLRIPRGKTFPAESVREGVSYGFALGVCVTKPARDTASGTGVSIGLQSAARIKGGFERAALYCDEVLIEEFIPGENYRFLVYKGKCVSAVKRCLPLVIGNGRDTVAALIEGENKGRLTSSQWRFGDPVLMPLPLGARLKRTLKGLGLDLNSVPAAGREVPLAELSNYQFGASYEEVLDAAHPTVTAAAEKSAAAAGVALAGVDIISADIAGPDYRINEINTTPSIALHYFPRDARRRRDPIRMILSDAAGA